MQDAIRVGIAGLGRSGWNIHAAALERHPDFQITAVADAEADRRQEAVTRFGCQAYPDIDGLVADPTVELVVVATPSYTHADIACRALEAGKHVLVEKPMATSLAEADRMIDAARSTGRVLTIFQNRRLDPDFEKVKEIIDSGILGSVFLVKMSRHNFQRRSDWQTLRRYGGGMLNNWGAHVVDQGLLLLGGEPEQIFADLKHTVSAGDAEDHVKIVLKGSTGLVVDIEVTSASAFPAPHWVVLGTCGSLQGSGPFQCKYFDAQSLPRLEAQEGPAEGRRYGAKEDIPWNEQEFQIERRNTSDAYYNRLYATLRKGEPLFVTPESVRLQLAVFEEARRIAGF